MKSMFGVFISLVAQLCLITGAETGECGLYLAPSTLPGAGRGIISGKFVAKGEEVENTVTLNIGHEHSVVTQLNNYVFGTGNEDYSTIIFGGGVLYNHMEPKTVQHHWYAHEEDLVDANINPLPFTNANPAVFIAQMDVVPGQEIYSTYGLDWFQGRGMTEQTVFEERTKESVAEVAQTPATLVSQEDLKRYGHCLTDVYISQSTIPFAGKGLFAKKAFSKGDNVVIAPVLTIPRWIVEDTARDNVVLKNYCMTVPRNESDVTLFPLNNAVLINHQPGNGANMKIRWYDWSSIRRKGSYFDKLSGGSNAVSLKEKLGQTVDEIFAAKFAPFDIRYIALRDIAAGEELFVDYGPTWQAKWEAYLESLFDWQNANFDDLRPLQEGFNTFQTTAVGAAELSAMMMDTVKDNDGDHSDIPRFRSYIEIPTDMFPRHWLRWGEPDPDHEEL